LVIPLDEGPGVGYELKDMAIFIANREMRCVTPYQDAAYDTDRRELLGHQASPDGKEYDWPVPHRLSLVLTIAFSLPQRNLMLE